MTPKSIYVAGLDSIQNNISPLFKKEGFKKKGRTYNKQVEDGLVHVINFQMGEFPLGDSYVVPGLRENLYGKFAINLGVFIPNIAELEYRYPTKSFVREYCCTIRKRLTEHSDNEKDQWFDITPDTTDISTRLMRLFELRGVPFLDQFSSLSDVFSFYQLNKNLPFNNEGRSKFDIALINFSIGNYAEFERHIREILLLSKHKGFNEHVIKVASKLGLNL